MNELVERRNLLDFQVNLNNAVNLLSLPGTLELDQEYGFAHLNEVMRSRTHQPFGLSSIRHLDAWLGLGLRLH